MKNFKSHLKESKFNIGAQIDFADSVVGDRLKDILEKNPVLIPAAVEFYNDLQKNPRTSNALNVTKTYNFTKGTLLDSLKLHGHESKTNKNHYHPVLNRKESELYNDTISVFSVGYKISKEMMNSLIKNYEVKGYKHIETRDLFNNGYYGVLTFKGKIEESEKDPCWNGYEQLGTKKKNGKTVPNCVKEDEINESVDIHNQTIQNLLKRYHDLKLKSYKYKLDDKQAEIAAKFALEDMIVTTKSNLEIYKDIKPIVDYLNQEIDDLIKYLNTKFHEEQNIKLIKKAEEENQRKSLHGFEHTLSKIQAGKAIEALTNKQVSVGGKFYHSRRDAIIYEIENNHKRVQTIRNERRFIAPNGNFFNEKDITKLGMDFAEYYINNVLKEK